MPAVPRRRVDHGPEDERRLITQLVQATFSAQHTIEARLGG